MKNILLGLCCLISWHAYALRPIDASATPETIALMNNLAHLSQEGVLFGHHNAVVEGRNWRRDGMSDIEAVSGKFPALVGFDFYRVMRAKSKNWDYYLDKVKEVYDRGSVVTFSWHMKNPITGGSAHDRTRAIEAILPGGHLHDKFLEDLDDFALFAKNARGSDGKLIPIIFRPWHEHTGIWFWWRARMAQENYRRLWRFTVDYLKNIKEVHNLLYAYSPARCNCRRILFRRRYFIGYPGDQYVDILGLDHYTSSISRIDHHLKILIGYAKRKNKIAALTETGSEGIQNSQYWTNGFLNPLKNNRSLRGLSYVMFWRNAGDGGDDHDHYYVPFPGERSVDNFNLMAQDPFVYFTENLPFSLYSLGE